MKNYNVVFDNSAEDDVYEIYRYIALNDSVEHAEKIYNAIRAACNKLKTLPNRGHCLPELYDFGVTEFREIHYRPYRIIYSIEKKNVYVHAVIDGRRDVQTILSERNLR